MKSSLSILHLLHNVKSMAKILSIFVAFLENMNFTKIYFVKVPLNVKIVKQDLLHRKPFLKWGPKGGILIFVDNGPLGCYLWCHGDCLLGFLTFIQFAHGHGHAVIDDWILYTYIVVSSSTFSILKLDNIKDGNIWKVKIGIYIKLHNFIVTLTGHTFSFVTNWDGYAEKSA